MVKVSVGGVYEIALAAVKAEWEGESDAKVAIDWMIVAQMAQGMMFREIEFEKDHPEVLGPDG